MKYRQVIIKEVDLKKLLKKKSLYRLSKQSGVQYPTLSKAVNGHIVLSENSWNKIKPYLK